MKLEESIKVKNYKCFGEQLQGFDSFYPINIIIGKNNSGKSTLLDIIDYSIKPNESFINTGRNRKKAEIILSSKIGETHIHTFPSSTSGGGIPGNSHHAYGRTLLGKSFNYNLDIKGQKNILHWEELLIPEAKQYVAAVERMTKTPFQNKLFFRISAERDIGPEVANNNDLVLSSNGVGATNLIRQIITRDKYDRNIIEKQLLKCLNEIIQPDIEFLDIVVQENDTGLWEIYFEDKYNNLIAVSRMGSGIKTILLVLLNLIVIPTIKEKERKEFVFGFEELENNLHPSLLRRLFNYIIFYSKQNESYFFITTHSSIVIDLFGLSNNSQILHVENQNSESTVTTVVSPESSRRLIKDLDVRPSDLLLSNGIVWVEGPSDALYLELLLKLYKEYINDSNAARFNYTIQSLSTAIWKYAGYEEFNWEKMDDDLQNKIISLEKLNHNHLLIIDKDDNYEDKKPSDWNNFQHGTGKNKAKLIFESMTFAGNEEIELVNNSGDTNDGKLFFWINDGTFETYLEHFANNKGKERFKLFFHKHATLGFFEKKRQGPNSSVSKVELAYEIAVFCSENDVTILDIAPTNSLLFDKLARLYQTIKGWN